MSIRARTIFILIAYSTSVFINFDKAVAELDQLDTDVDDWFSWDVDTTKLKRWTTKGLCDHDAMTSVLLKSILDIQDKIKVGNPSIGIPPMDPLYISKLAFEASSNSKNKYGIKGELMNVLVEGMSTFHVLNIQSDLMEMEANVSLSIEGLKITGDYKMGGLIGFVIPIYGHGKFLLHPKQATVSVFSKFGYNNGHLELSYFDFKINLTELAVKFDGILGAGRRISKAFNKILNSFGLKVFNKLEPRIHEKVRQRGVDEINKILLDIKFNGTLIMEMLQIPLRCMFG